MMIFSGGIIRLSHLLPWIAWMKWTSAFRYAINMLSINEYHEMKFCLSNQTDICLKTGKEVLHDNEITYETSIDLWKNFFGLIIISFVVLLIAFIRLILMKKTK